jgi:hypothetical protein
MKKTLMCATLLASSLVARAETLHVHLAVGFPATGTYLPAGDYSIARVTGSPSMLFIEGEGLRAFISGRIVRNSSVEKPTIELDKDLEKGKSAGTRAGVLKLHSQAK